MKKNILLFVTLQSSFLFSQVGINTTNPQGVFHIDGKSTAETTNTLTGIPTAKQLSDDFIVTGTGATGIGGTPHASAILDLSSSNKGFVAPRVALTSSTDQTTISNPTIGLLVYNLGTDGLTSQGYMYWNGREWMKFDDSATINPEIGTLICGSATLKPAVYTDGVPYTGNLKISYTEGNGGSYQAGATITVNGLDFTLRPGKLEFGAGELIFSVTGTPTVSSPTATTLPIQGSGGNNIVPFLTSALQCSARVGDNVNAEIKTNATVGSMFLTNDPSTGYHRFVTSPDGKYSVRVVINEGGTFGNSDLQIRSNLGTPTILWNSGTQYVSGFIGNGNNGMTFPSPDVWYGNGGGNSTSMGSVITNAWGNLDVYFGSPEWRRYTWTSTDASDPTMYVLEFMLGAPSPSIVANTDNCPAGTCTQTKAYLRITEIKGQ